MSSDQLTYVLVAGLVTGLAILLLLAGAFVARRGARGERPSAQPAAAPAAAPLAAVPASPGPEPRLEPARAAPEPPLAPDPEPEPEPERELRPALAPAPGLAPAPAGPVVAAAEESEVTAADIEAAKGRVHDPREEEFIQGFLSGTPRRRDVAAAEAVRPPTAVGPAPTAPPGAEPPSTPLVASPPPGASSAEPVAAPRDPYVDEPTGLDSRAAWERAIAEENARYVRYRRPVSVVVGELDGLNRFEERLGPEAARRILGAVGGTLRRGARRTDRVAHAGGGRFLVLMPETDEIQAINYVERVRTECERWLEAGEVSLRLSLGWASPSAVGELDTALRTAEERMYAERRRAARAGIGEPGAPR